MDGTGVRLPDDGDTLCFTTSILDLLLSVISSGPGLRALFKEGDDAWLLVDDTDPR